MGKPDPILNVRRETNGKVEFSVFLLFHLNWFSEFDSLRFKEQLLGNVESLNLNPM